MERTGKQDREDWEEWFDRLGAWLFIFGDDLLITGAKLVDRVEINNLRGGR